VSAIQAVRAHGIFDRYMTELAPQAREDLLSLVAGVWIPLELAVTHYGALDRLNLDRAVIEAIGGDVANRVNKSFLSTIVRASRGAGVTPWTLLKQSQRFRELSWRGSDVAVFNLGPKEARFEWVGQPLAGVPYFVTSFGGYLRALCGLFCTKAYARLERGFPRGESIQYRVSWA
jgi:hypothetical protein